jgi:hypothetical protein
MVAFEGDLVFRITKFIAEIPIDRGWGKEKLKILRPIYIILMLLSIVTIFGSLALFSKILS